MDTAPTQYIEQLDHARDDVRQILLGLDEHSLNWKPTTDAPSIFKLAQRIAWYEQGMIGHVWGQQPIGYGWPDDDTLPDADDDASDLLFMLDEAATLTRSVVSAADPATFDEPFVRLVGGEQYKWTPRSLLNWTIMDYLDTLGIMSRQRHIWEMSQDTGT